MRIDLIELLRSRPIVHPTRIVSTSISSNAVRVTVRGYPWWRDAPSPPEEQSIEFVFEGIARGQIELEDFESDCDEALEEFDVVSMSEVGWAQADEFSIYCSSTLNDPLELHLRVHDFLNEADAYRRPGEFLNCASGRLAKFVEITSSNSYMVARGPECIRDIVCRELERQGVAYNVIATPTKPACGMLIRLAQSHFVCTAAFAEFPE